MSYSSSSSLEKEKCCICLSKKTRWVRAKDKFENCNCVSTIICRSCFEEINKCPTCRDGDDEDVEVERIPACVRIQRNNRNCRIFCCTNYVWGIYIIIFFLLSLITSAIFFGMYTVKAAKRVNVDDCHYLTTKILSVDYANGKKWLFQGQIGGTFPENKSFILYFYKEWDVRVEIPFGKFTIKRDKELDYEDTFIKRFDIHERYDPDLKEEDIITECQVDPNDHTNLRICALERFPNSEGQYSKDCNNRTYEITLGLFASSVALTIVSIGSTIGCLIDRRIRNM